MEFTELIAERRSIRKYESAVPRDEMEVILAHKPYSSRE